MVQSANARLLQEAVIGTLCMRSCLTSMVQSRTGNFPPYVQAEQEALCSQRGAAEAEVSSLRAQLALAQERLEAGEGSLNRQLAEAGQRHKRTAAAAEEQAARADKWEGQCISAPPALSIFLTPQAVHACMLEHGL